MSQSNVIQIEGITKSFGKKVVLNNINFNIKEGNIYGFIGPSGSGKTTLVKLIVGMDIPNEGFIEVLGKKCLI